MIHDDDVVLLSMIADTMSPSIFFGKPSPKSMSPLTLLLEYFWLVNFSILILFYLMSIQVMEISRRTSIIRGLYDVG